MRITRIGVEIDEMRKVVHKIINQAHIVISINTGKLYPVTAEHLVIREDNPEIQGDTDEYGYYYAGNKSWRKSTLTHLLVLESYFIVAPAITQGFVLSALIFTKPLTSRSGCFSTLPSIYETIPSNGREISNNQFIVSGSKLLCFGCTLAQIVQWGDSNLRSVISEPLLIVELIPVAMVKPESRNQGGGGVSVDGKIFASLFRPVLPVVL